MSAPGCFPRVTVRYADGTPREWVMVPTSAQRRKDRRSARRVTRHLQHPDCAKQLAWVKRCARNG